MRLSDVAPRLGKAWDQYRTEHWRQAELLAPKLRAPGETHLEATRRIYMTAMEFNMRRRRP